MTRGGDELTITKVKHITPKALAQWRERLGSTQNAGVLAEILKGVTIRLQADGSPYWIYTSTPTRYVFCAAHGRQIGPETMVLVTVTDEWEK